MRPVAAFLEEVVNSTAITYHQSFVSPFITQDLHQQPITVTTGRAFEAVVGTHYFLHTSLLHQVLESGQIGFPQVTWINVFSVEAMTVPLGTRVDGIMLGTGMRLVILTVFRALQTSNDGHTQLAR